MSALPGYEATGLQGLLLIDKPAGWTSHDVVAKLRGILRGGTPMQGGATPRVGHAGTLDPFATGLLVLGVGKGTKRLTALVGVDKEYEATIRLGATSDTFDVEGKIVETVGAYGHAPGTRADNHPPLQEIERALDQFRGGYEQLAPLYSAKKIGGKKLYDLARAGKATEEMRPRKHVKIYALNIEQYEWPDLMINVKCSSGTYIRSLADDIGRALGVGGYCLELRRTKVGEFDVRDAIPMEGPSTEALRAQVGPSTEANGAQVGLSTEANGAQVGLSTEANGAQVGLTKDKVLDSLKTQ